MYHNKIRAVVNGAKLFAYDFDLTLARTNQPSPRGMTVENAYAQALDQILGTEGALDWVGGLQNRAPVEVAHAALPIVPDARERIYAYAREHADRLSYLVPEGGVDLALAHVRGDLAEYFAEVLVRAKLGLLVEDVGRHVEGGVWPRHEPGLDVLFARDARPRGVVSSGHQRFIERCFSAWGIERPAHMVTDDTMRGLALPIHEKVKPSPRLVDYLRASAYRSGLDLAPSDIVFCGDDLGKDGELACRSGMRFIWYNPKGAFACVPEGAVEIRHYDELTAAL